MNYKHIAIVIATLAVGYFIGLKYPNFYKGQF